jgi:glucosamine-phosphate N-acetyltransferase
MVVNIREIELSDFEMVVKLLEQLWPDKELNRNSLLKVFSTGIRSQDNMYLCAEIDGKVVGFCSLAIRESLLVEGLFAHIDELIIDESLRRVGFGAELLKAASAAAKKRGCKIVELDSALHREAAHRFYSKEGFAKRAYLFSKEL